MEPDLDPIEPIGPSPEVTTRDANAVVRGLAPHASYAAADLYKRYVQLCTAQNRQPAHPVVLGRKLKHIGCVRSRKGFGKNARWAWVVVPSAQDPRWSDGTWP